MLTRKCESCLFIVICLSLGWGGFIQYVGSVAMLRFKFNIQ